MRLLFIALLATAVAMSFVGAETTEKPFSLDPLPYSRDALEPAVSAKTVEFHYDKHHRGYLNKLNELVSGTDMAAMRLEDVIARTAGQAGMEAVFNNAAQVWNHTFYWNSLAPNGPERPSGDIAAKIDICFGSYENFARQMLDAGASQFGSGWVWLIEEEGALKILKTPNAENPISLKRGKALLVLDVWEHGYYLDYQNRRADYLKALIDRHLNWDFARRNLEGQEPSLIRKTK